MHSNHYYLFLDESGTGDLKPTKQCKALVLAGVLINRPTYVRLSEEFYNLKAKHWTHPETIHFHSYDIKKGNGSFAKIRANQAVHESFIESIFNVIRSTNFTLLCGAIDKTKERQPNADLYHQAFKNLFERCVYNIQKTPGVRLTAIFEERNKDKNHELRQYFHDLVHKTGTEYVDKSSFQSINPVLLFKGKSDNVPGLEVADICAAPIRKFVENRGYSGRDFDAVKTKLKCDARGNFMGWGLKVFP